MSIVPATVAEVILKTVKVASLKNAMETMIPNEEKNKTGEKCKEWKALSSIPKF